MTRPDIVLTALISGPASAKELTGDTGLSICAVNRALGKLHAARLVRICEWRKLPDSITLVRVFEVGGRKADAPKPPNRYERQKAATAAAQRRTDKLAERRRNNPFASLLAFGSSASKE